MKGLDYRDSEKDEFLKTVYVTLIGRKIEGMLSTYFVSRLNNVFELSVAFTIHDFLGASWIERKHFFEQHLLFTLVLLQ